MNKRVAIGAALAVVGLIALTGIGILVAGGDDPTGGMEVKLQNDRFLAATAAVRGQ